MRVKEIDRTANIAWSPAAQHPIYIAAGTAAQQLDATFSTSAAVELYHLDLGEAGMEMEMVGSITTDCRFHKLVWGSYGMDTDDQPSGLLMGGADNGNLFVWNPSKIINNEDPLVHKLDKHSGAVAALDINPFQKNLLASGASESEIYIWDLNNPANPMTPGAKSQPPDDVTCIAWNRQVQHILASTYAGRCVVWDLRKNEPIIKVSDSMARIKCKLVAWQPEVATQLCLASEDDHTPVIQLWDLRFATSPLKLLENHTRGILSMAWCPQDPDLLLSCGKDNRILCWNPNTQAQAGEVVYELPTSNQWSFDVQWCPRNPAMISSCSFDGHISVHSLMGGTPPPKAPSKVADSFSTDPFSQPPGPQPTNTGASGEATPVVLKKAPKWLRRPVGASFAFGGKLVTFEQSDSPAPAPAAQQQQQQQQQPQRVVRLSQVVTETELVARSDQLQAALASGQLAEFCSMKIANCRSDDDQHVWNFLKVHFETDPRQRYLQLLGYNQADLNKKVAALTSTPKADSRQAAAEVSNGVDATELADKMAGLDTNLPDEFYIICRSDLWGTPNLSSTLDSSSVVSTPGEVEAEDCGTAFDDIASTAKKTAVDDKPLPFSTGNTCEGLVTAALLTADFSSAVEVCLYESRYAEAIILAIAGGPELLRQTQQRFLEQRRGDELSRLIGAVVGRRHQHIMRTCSLDNWREALALALTYAKPDEFSSLCDILGERLEAEDGGSHAWNACLCYICAGNVDKLVQCWIHINRNQNTPAALQDLVEKVTLLRQAVERGQGGDGAVAAEGPLARKLSKYAELLASEGSLTTAANYLGNSQEESLAVMRDRLYEALGQPLAQKPFSVYNVQAEGAPASAAPDRPQQQQQQGRHRSNSGFHQSQAGQSNTTPTSSYHYPTPAYTQPTPSNQYPTPGNQYPAPTAQPAMFNPATMGTPSQPPSGGGGGGGGVLAKGLLAQKYPASSTVNTPFDQYNTPPAAATAAAAAATDSQYNAYNPASGYADPPPQPPAAPPALYDPTSHSTPGAPPYGGGPASNPPPSSQTSSFQDHKPSSAWNDPPPVTRKKKLSESSYEAPPAMMAPIVGAPQDQGPPGAPSYGQYYNPQQYQNQPAPASAAPAPVAAEPPKPVVKAPIPAEDQVLKDILEALTNQCMEKAANPQTKRKMEDVMRKLETLYDKLRTQSLSPAVVGGLHQLVQCIQQYDYASALHYHSHMVSQGNFSEISSFMPGIKILMQTAHQMQVFVQQ